MSKSVIIIGGGPAGISASLYTIRAGIDTTVITQKNTALKNAENIQNYYGFVGGICGEELFENGIASCEKIGGKVIYEEVVGLTFDGQYVVETPENTYKADALIIATGSQRATPKIKGFADFEGKGISYCAVCDAFFYRGKDVAVLGSGDYALHEVNSLKDLASKVVLITNGVEPTTTFPENVDVITKKVKEIKGENTVGSVVFDDDTELNVSGIFVAMGVAGSTGLAKKIGAVTENNKIVVNEKMATNLNGLYSAGDCTGGLLQVSKAVYEGAVAGTEVVKYLKTLGK